MSGLFITFEGGEGAGKSTQAALLAERLRAAGREVVLTREPGGTPVAEQIRRVVLDLANAGIDDRTEALLYAASRAEHVAKKIRPALEAGDVVISDRYLDSSVAYQGVARGLGADQVLELNLWATADLLPDLTVLLDVEAGHGLSRASDPNRLEAEPESFHAEVREAFLSLAAANPERYLVLPAASSREALAEQIWQAVQTRLAGR